MTALERRPADVSASGLGKAAACPAAFAFGIPHVVGADRPYEGGRGGGSHATRGTYIHKVFELRIRGADLPAALAGARRIPELGGRAPHHTWVAWGSSYDPAELLPPGYAWTPETRWTLPLGALVVGGTPDAVGVRGADAYVPDWKSSRGRGDDSSVPASWALARASWDEHKAAGHRLQMAFHAAAALHHLPAAERVTTDLVYLGPPAAKGERGQVWGEQRLKVERGSETHTSIMRRLTQVTARVAAARALPDPHAAARPGLWCRYCPAGERNGGPCTRSREVVAPWPGGLSATGAALPTAQQGTAARLAFGRAAFCLARRTTRR